MTPEDAWLYQWADAAITPHPRFSSERIGVAVSGGSDSMATLMLLADAHPVEAVTVDHGLRPEAADEARFVAQLCAERGIPHTILHWQGPEDRGNLMDQARRARLELIGAWAQARGIAQVALGHTRDDQAETFLMRLAREAGLEGLSGMRARFEAEGVLWLRPFLMVGRDELRGYLSRQGIGWIEDPSNENDRFDRVKARKALRALRPLGITSEKLSHVVSHLAVAESALVLAVHDFANDHVAEVSGDLLIEAEPFQRAPHEVQRRLIVAALRWVAGADYAPRARKVADFLLGWRARPDRTLHGCRIRVSDTEIRIAREARAVAGLRVSVGKSWDRWQLEGPAVEGQEIAALGAQGLQLCPNWRESGLPRASLLASPAVWQGDTLVSAPVAGLESGWKARIVCGSFHSSLFRR
ncbi:tRNA lysidine(34) synthetase TilS [Sinirhodobacter sp. WL0062]|uniref:tRNA(Ile)-lysidine synthase n=1 Tax=Rhodobacter flavimaris TaxID=2907145 RepID=A0ABS8YYC3_9RHOB|nr:tRNA lysidine(34) synthetase TilS [Sinirhodobacter sp. WL0062]MCE5973607.1 tRNA lysidine(34) synthetase TilS [Sinirhodobacter sp. WL0062]